MPDGVTNDEVDDDRGSSHSGPPTMAKTHLALDMLRRAVAGESIHKVTCVHFYAFQKEVIGDLSKKKTQLDIRELCPPQVNCVYFSFCVRLVDTNFR